jgi:hypothetical protein
MVYRGIVKKGLIELEGEVILPTGTRVGVIAEEPCAIDIQGSERSGEIYHGTSGWQSRGDHRRGVRHR